MAASSGVQQLTSAITVAVAGLVTAKRLPSMASSHVLLIKAFGLYHGCLHPCVGVWLALKDGLRAAMGYVLNIYSLAEVWRIIRGYFRIFPSVCACLAYVAFVAFDKGL